MWQAINYNDAMFNSTYSSGGHYGTAQGTLISSDSPLKPFFRDNNGTPWTSKQVVQPSTFGYTYPEMSRAHSMVASDLATYVITQVNHLYAPKSRQSRLNLRRAAREISAGTSKTTDYTAEISVDRSELAVPCNIQLLLSGAFVGQMILLNEPKVGQAYTTVQLSDAIAQRIVETTPDVVIPFLKQNLEACIVKVCTSHFTRLVVTF
jgi:tyrosinase